MIVQKPLGHAEAIAMLCDSIGVTVLSYEEAIEGYFKLRGLPIPAGKGAIHDLYTAHQQLRSEGWQEIQYCPKDGTVFLAIEPGSTGIHDCCYMGEWPNGHWWGPEAGDMWPMRPVLFKLKS